jgi:transmembrane sensor
MTSMERIQRAGQSLDPGWEERDVERVWQGLKRKRRRRAVAVAAGVASAAGIAVLAMFVVPGRHAVVGPVVQSGPARKPALKPAPKPEGTLRFADGSTAVSSGNESSLAVVEDTPRRVVVALAKGGARFDVVPRAERVFSVRAGAVTVTVLGTAFSVERVADRVGVAVTRGLVQVDWGAGSRRVAAGGDGWFPPLVVSPPAVVPADEAGPIRHKRKPATDDIDAAPAPPSPESAAAPAETAAEPTAPGEPDPAKLLADADRARLAGRHEEGVALLRRLVREHPNDQRAPLAAFSLGRILLGDLHRPAQAAMAFARARALAPNGPLAEDALAREVEAWTRAGDLDRARARGDEYLRVYPNGSRAADVTEAVRPNR